MSGKLKGFLVVTAVWAACILSVGMALSKEADEFKLIYENSLKSCHAFAVSPDDSLVITLANYDFQIRDFRTMKVIQRLDYDSPSTCYSVAFFPDGKRFVLGSYCGVYLYDRTGKLIGSRETPAGRVLVSPSGRWVAAVTESRITLLDAADLKIITRLSGAEDFAGRFGMQSVLVLPDDTLLVGCSPFSGESGELIQFDVEDLTVRNRSDTDSPDIAACSSDGSLVLLRSGELINLQRGSFVGDITQGSGVEAAAFRPHSNQIAVAFSDGLLVADYQTGFCQELPIGGISHVSFDSRGTRMLAAGSGLFVMSSRNEHALPLEFDFRPAYIAKRAPLYSEPSLFSEYSHVLTPGSLVEVDRGPETDSNGFYWARVKIAVDGEPAVLNGYIYAPSISFEPVSTLADFRDYEKTIQRSWQRLDNWAVMLSNPEGYQEHYIEVSFTVNSTVLNFLEPAGIWVTLTSAQYGPFIVEMPYQELVEDWSKGWAGDDRFHAYLCFSHMEEFTDEHGQTRRVPVLRALAVYDGYRVIHF